MTQTGWQVIVPVKRTDEGKSRLATFAGPHRSSLALAVALDTIEAASAADQVARLVVVTDDVQVATAARKVGARVLADPGGGLNAALNHGADDAGASHRDAPIAALQGDLPSLRPTALAAALAAAAEHQRAFVADADGTGTTLLTAAGRSMFTPSFGIGSRAAHRRSGYTELAGPDLDGPGLDRDDARRASWAGLKRDVDTERSLRAAAVLGLGRHTRQVLAEIDAALRPNA